MSEFAVHARAVVQKSGVNNEKSARIVGGHRMVVWPSRNSSLGRLDVCVCGGIPCVTASGALANTSIVEDPKELPTAPLHLISQVVLLLGALPSLLAFVTVSAKNWRVLRRPSAYWVWIVVFALSWTFYLGWAGLIRARGRGGGTDTAASRFSRELFKGAHYPPEPIWDLWANSLGGLAINERLGLRSRSLRSAA